MTTSRQRFYLATLVAVCIAFGAATRSAKAAFHLWQVKEVFTNASGSVQFIEMFDSFGGETSVANKTLTANSDGNIKTFTFPSNISSTPGSMLIATTGFGSLPGAVTPDFTFDQSTTPFTGSFFNPNATNLTFTFSGSNDSMGFTGASLPKNGINSLTDAGAVGFPPGTPNISSGVNSPTNLLGNSGSVNVPAPTGDYNGNHTVDAGDYDVWRKTLNNSVSPAGNKADGDSSGTIGSGDYTYWRARFGNAAPGSGSLADGNVPEPATIALQLGWLFALTWRVRKRITARGE